MALTRKDFIKQAELLRSIRSESVRRRLMEEQIKIFNKANPRFDPRRFRKFVKEGKKK